MTPHTATVLPPPIVQYRGRIIYLLINSPATTYRNIFLNNRNSNNIIIIFFAVFIPFSLGFFSRRVLKIKILIIKKKKKKLYGRRRRRATPGITF